MSGVFRGVFSFAFMHSFQKSISDFGDFQTLLWRKKVHIEKALYANECVR